MAVPHRLLGRPNSSSRPASEISLGNFDPPEEIFSPQKPQKHGVFHTSPQSLERIFARASEISPVLGDRSDAKPIPGNPAPPSEHPATCRSPAQGRCQTRKTQPCSIPKSTASSVTPPFQLARSPSREMGSRGSFSSRSPAAFREGFASGRLGFARLRGPPGAPLRGPRSVACGGVGLRSRLGQEAARRA